MDKIRLLKMKKILLTLILFFTLSLPIYSYSITDVSSHNLTSDCWVIFEEKVYDLTEYLQYHDIYLDIRDWCGRDITKDFITKDGTDRNHNQSSYALLEEYFIGDVKTDEAIPELTYEESVSQNTTEDNTEVTIDEDTAKSGNPYNIIIPLLLSNFLYWFPYFLIMSKKKTLLKNFNAFWNTSLITLLLIPAFGFGIFMILRYKFPGLWNINFDFMFWHVELSLVMGMLAINHFLQRIKTYFVQLK